MLPMMVTDGTLLKIYAWYDNEVGYACRMVDLADIVIRGSLACPSSAVAGQLLALRQRSGRA
jgi:hypothetical protein